VGLPPVRNFTDNVSAPVFPLPYTIRGVTKDSTGAALGACGVVLLRTADNSVAACMTSDANGNYRMDASPFVLHRVDAYKAGSPDVAGTTVNTLVGTPD
jgi:hypothetical protein